MIFKHGLQLASLLNKNPMGFYHRILDYGKKTKNKKQKQVLWSTSVLSIKISFTDEHNFYEFWSLNAVARSKKLKAINELRHGPKTSTMSPLI